jgi:hypothetical protein
LTALRVRSTARLDAARIGVHHHLCALAPWWTPQPVPLLQGCGATWWVRSELADIKSDRSEAVSRLGPRA